ncbi:MAG TPA: hypothetical protein VGC97_22035 [Pyrinomonadaceae bacterium]|jgi:hypothetical protein
MKIKFIVLLPIFLTFCFAAKAQFKEPFADVPTVSYCGLIENAEKYDQQFVRVTATYFSAFEGSLLFDDSCENRGVSWAHFVSAYEKNTNSFLLKRFRQLTKGSIQSKPREVLLSVVAKFDGKRKISTLKVKDRTFTFSVGFGHDDAFDYQLTVLKIEEVRKLKK